MGRQRLRVCEVTLRGDDRTSRQLFLGSVGRAVREADSENRRGAY